jgi:hypothetical protein
MEPVCPNTPMRGWSILTTIEDFIQQERPQCGGTEAIFAGRLGRKGDPYSAKLAAANWGGLTVNWGPECRLSSEVANPGS